MRRGLFLLLVLAVTASAQIPMGATKQEVIELIGWPTSTSKAGEREILTYPDLTIVLEKNRLTNLHFKPGKHKLLSSYLLAAPKATPAALDDRRVVAPKEILGSNADRQGISPTLSKSPAVTTTPARPQPAETRPTPRPVDPFAQMKSKFAWMIGLFVALAFLKTWLEKSKRRRPREVDDLFPPPPRKTPGGLPPIVIPRRDPPAKPDPLRDGWSLALLKELEWHRFEQVIAAYERELGNDAELTDFGPDGGVDVRVFNKGSRTPKRIIQCKAYSKPIGVNLVRELLGVMTLQKIPRGTFYTTSSYSDDVLAAFQTERNLELINGPTFLNRIQALPLSAQLKLFEIATEGDYTTPTCPSCGVKMITKKFDESPGEGKWTCRNFPRCRQKPMTKKQTD